MSYICNKNLKAGMKAIRQLINAILICVLTFGVAGCEDQIGAGQEKPGTGNEQKPGTGDQEGPGNGDGTGEGTGNGTGEGTGVKENEFVILFTNDFHSQIEPLSKEETYNADRGGVKRIKALVDSVRNAEKTVYLADAGDYVQGTYYFSLLNGSVEMEVMDQLKYDVRTVGNHEFDKKMTCLYDMLTWSDVPVVASNYDFSRTNLANRVEQSMIIEKNGIKVGFIGLNVKLDNLVAPSAREGVDWQNAINVADQLAKDKPHKRERVKEAAHENR